MKDFCDYNTNGISFETEGTAIIQSFDHNKLPRTQVSYEPVTT